jgi:DNA-binding transcriptional regulator YiaG
MDWTPAAIKALRLRLRLSQEQFADRIGCARSLVSLWESGQRVPSRMACKALDTLAKEDT